MMRRVILLSLITAALIGMFAAFQKTFNITVSISALIMPAPNNVSANWQNAGLSQLPPGSVIGAFSSRTQGIPIRTTVCATVNPIGGGTSDVTNIRNAINSCPAGQVVMLGSASCLPNCAFTTTVADTNGQVPAITIPGGITVRGAGTCSNSTPPYCQTSITQIDGMVLFSVTPCGATGTSGGGPCAQASIFFMGPPGSGAGVAWANCTGNLNWGTSVALGVTVSSTNCGAATLAVDAVQGQTTIQVNDNSMFKTACNGSCVGTEVFIDEASAADWEPSPLDGPPNNLSCTAIWAAPDWLASSPSPATGRLEYAKGENCSIGGLTGDYGGVGSGLFPYNGGYSCNTTYGIQSCDRNTNEIHQLASIGPGPCPGTNCTLTFTDPLSVSFRQSGNHNAQVYWGPGSGGGNYTGMAQQAGLENISILRGSGGTLKMLFCAYCWLLNVEMSEWGGGGLVTADSWRSQLEGVVADSIWFSNNDGNEYPISFDGGDTEMLVENSIVNRAGKGGVGRGGGGPNVWAYNYIDSTMYNTWPNFIGDYWMDEGANASHLTGAHHHLFEGNRAPNCDNDATHGNNMYHVYFRNHCVSYRSPFFDPSYPASNPNNTGVTENDLTGPYYSGIAGSVQAQPAPGNVRAAGINIFNYWHAFVGNVLGNPGVTTTANGWVYQRDYVTGGGNRGMWETYGDPYVIGTKGTYYFRHGNYDAVNNSIVDYQAGYSQTLPNSLYLTSSPSFFGTGTTGCTYPWPWVNSAASPQLSQNSCGGSGLPAKARWDSGKPMVQP